MRLIGLLLCVAGLSACQKHDVSIEPQPQLSDAVASIDSIPIYKDELALVIKQTVGDFGAIQLGTSGREKVLESLIIRKLMSDKQFQQMDSEERQLLELEMKAFREELLTKRYIKQQVQAEPVTPEMILDYYNNNPKLFGAKQIRRFEMVRADVSHSPKLQQELSILIQGLTPHSNWKLTIDEARQNGQPVFLVSGNSAEKGLIDDYQQVIQKLEQGEISPLHSINGILVRFRITELVNIAAKPIAEVTPSIRKSLAPIQLKKSIQQEAELLMHDREIERYAME
ncbi:peptidylprolyl isomerase [Shewanella sp. 10N.286.52.B9]|uniref:peptidylprolyl isomerase n=1 Tax=Shewanella sp. 10N.286.52.B9 TaxID=1880837 RepID=UPI000C81B9B8|nr:peptidylprolyl isomerase [Shewanella sp. 10N.286.52.B9]PMG39255.1 hypothetical protein BCU91_15470 [Shewanella sp. 10N.286.52.B9]